MAHGIDAVRSCSPIGSDVVQTSRVVLLETRATGNDFFRQLHAGRRRQSPWPVQFCCDCAVQYKLDLVRSAIPGRCREDGNGALRVSVVLVARAQGRYGQQCCEYLSKASFSSK